MGGLRADRFCAQFRLGNDAREVVRQYAGAAVLVRREPLLACDHRGPGNHRCCLRGRDGRRKGRDLAGGTACHARNDAVLRVRPRRASFAAVAHAAGRGSDAIPRDLAAKMGRKCLIESLIC